MECQKYRSHRCVRKFKLTAGQYEIINACDCGYETFVQSANGNTPMSGATIKPDNIAIIKVNDYGNTKSQNTKTKTKKVRDQH